MLGLRNLSKLILTRNKLKSIGDNAFENLESLNELGLNSNLLTQISKSTLSFNQSVKSLRLFLNNNRLNDSSFDENTFNNTIENFEIHLESNRITNSDERIFGPPIDRSNKTTIYLGNNPINCQQIKWLNESSIYKKAIKGIEC